MAAPFWFREDARFFPQKQGSSALYRLNTLKQKNSESSFSSGIGGKSFDSLCRTREGNHHISERREMVKFARENTKKKKKGQSSGSGFFGQEMRRVIRSAP